MTKGPRLGNCVGISARNRCSITSVYTGAERFQIARPWGGLWVAKGSAGLTRSASWKDSTGIKFRAVPLTFGSVSRFRFFEAEEVDVTAVVAGNDQSPVIGERTATRSTIAREGGQHLSGFQVPLASSHTFSVWSQDAETARCPSGVTATASTGPEWPVRVRSSRPLPSSHTFSVWSQDTETARCPSGVTATASTGPEWPVRVRSSRPLPRSHTFSVWS